jgi:uncharacterized protein YggE
LAACAAALSAVVVLAGCDSAPPVNADARQVTVVGSGEVRGTPDTVTADVGIEVIAPDVTAAMNQVNQRQRAVIDALTGGGVEAKDISTTTVNVAPQYGENSAITGYRANNTLAVTIRELDAAPGALATVVDVGGNAARINAVTYSIEDDSKLIKDARAKAFEDARSRAEQYAELSGLSLGKVIAISETPGGDAPRMIPAAPEAMAADVPLQPGEQTVSFSVTAVWELT